MRLSSQTTFFTSHPLLFRIELEPTDSWHTYPYVRGGEYRKILPEEPPGHVGWGQPKMVHQGGSPLQHTRTRRSPSDPRSVVPRHRPLWICMDAEPSHSKQNTTSFGTLEFCSDLCLLPLSFIWAFASSTTTLPLSGHGQEFSPQHSLWCLSH